MFDLLKSMAIFSEVARLGSFRAAAKSQDVSPSVISRHVSNLEESLGEVLLTRSTRKLALTTIGKRFLVHCDAMLESASLGLASVKDNLGQGKLRITLPITLITTKFAHSIKKFREKNPQIEFSFIYDDSNIDIVEAGVDIALRLGPLQDSSLKSKRVADISRLIVCTPEYLSEHGEISSLEDLNQQCWIGRKNPAIAPNLISPNGEVYTIPKQAKFIQVNNVEAVKVFVLSHNGLGLLSDMLVEKELESGQVVRVLPNWQVESMGLYAVWSAQKTTGQLVRKFVAYLSRELNQIH